MSLWAAGQERTNMIKYSLNGSDWLFKEFVGLDWVWRDSVKPVNRDTRWWNKGTIPGSVLQDLLKIGAVPSPYYDCQSKLCEWISARTWVYKKNFVLPAGFLGKKLILTFEGIDYSGDVFLNGDCIGRFEGMFIPFTKNITELVKYGEENLLAVVIEAAPQEQAQVGKTSLVKTHKSRMTYWWDFCPRLIHQGIWDEVYIEVAEELLEELWIRAELSEDLSEAKLLVEAKLTGGTVLEVLTEPGTSVAFPVQNNSAQGEISIHNPRLWWPNGYGEPFEYKLTVRILEHSSATNALYTKTICYGIRKIEFLPNDNAASDVPPFVLHVNQVKVYMKGYNWVPMDLSYGVERPNKLKRLIQLAKEAHVNLFRVWGGGLIEKESFYRICAENGILIWQEFIQSSSGIDNDTPKDQAYFDLMSHQAEIIIKKRRNETALALWCGGNELQDQEGMPLNNSDTLLSMLKQKVEALDNRPWLPTSPSGGVFSNSIENIEKDPQRLQDVHGPWEHQGIREQYRLYNMGTSLLHSEFGVEGMTNVQVLKKYTAADKLLPASKDNEVYFHRGAWWNNEPLVVESFGGGPLSIEELIKASQYMQYEGLKYAVEANRRRAYNNSGSFPWQFNEPFPNNFCTSSLDYHANPKPAYYGVKQAYSPILISASFQSASLAKDRKVDVFVTVGSKLADTLGLDEIQTDDRAVNDSNTSSKNARDRNASDRNASDRNTRDRNASDRNVNSRKVSDREANDKMARIKVLDIYGNEILRQELSVDLKEHSSEKILSFEVPAENLEYPLCLLQLELIDDFCTIASNEYLFTVAKDYKPLLNLPKTEINCRVQDNEISLTNLGKTAAFYLFLSDNNDLPEPLAMEETNWLSFSQNYLNIMPGQTVTVQVEQFREGEALNIRVDGFGI